MRKCGDSYEWNAKEWDSNKLDGTGTWQRLCHISCNNHCKSWLLVHGRWSIDQRFLRRWRESGRFHFKCTWRMLRVPWSQIWGSKHQINSFKSLQFLFFQKFTIFICVFQLTFEGLWSRNTHPKGFPRNVYTTKFGDIIGATHKVGNG